MRTSRFTDEQIVGILQEAERSGKTGDVIRRHGISRETFYRWRRVHWGFTCPGERLPVRRYPAEHVVVLVRHREQLQPGETMPVLHDVESSLAGSYAPALVQAAQPRQWWRLGRRRPVLTADEYVTFFAAMPTHSAWEANPAQAAASLNAWSRANPKLAERIPARALLAEMRRILELRQR